MMSSETQSTIMLRNMIPLFDSLWLNTELVYGSTYRQYELQSQGQEAAQPKTAMMRSFVLKDDQLGSTTPSHSPRGTDANDPESGNQEDKPAEDPDFGVVSH